MSEQELTVEQKFDMIERGEDLPTVEEPIVKEETVGKVAETVEETNPLLETKKEELPDDYFKTHFDGYENIDAVKTQLASVKDLTEKSEKYDEVFNTSEKYKTDLEDYKKRNPYQQDDLYRLSTIKSDEDLFKNTTQLLYGSNKSEDLLKMKFISDNPEYKGRDEEVSRLVLSEYGFEERIEKDEDGDVIEANVQYNADKRELIKDKMNLAAATAKRELLSQFNTIEIPEQKTSKSKEELAEEQKVETDKFVSTWKEPFTNVKESFAKFDLSQEVGDKNIPIEIELTEGEQQDLAKFTANMIINEKIEPTKENIESVKQVAINTYKAQNLNKIVSKAVEYAMSQTDETWREKVNNINPDVNTDKNVDVDDAAKKAAWKEFNELN